MASLIELFYRQARPAISCQGRSFDVSLDVGQEKLRTSMRNDFSAFARWMAKIYEELPQEAHKKVLIEFQTVNERVDQAYRENDWAAFQGALAEAQRIAFEVQRVQPINGNHWMYKTWSRVLDAEIWFAHCAEELAQLTKKGVLRRSIYTESELVELLHFPQPSSGALVDLHKAKMFFNAEVVKEVTKGGSAKTEDKVTDGSS